MQGHWLGHWGGNWLGGVTEAGNPILIAALDVGGVGSAVLTAQTIEGQPPIARPHGGRGFLAEKPRKKRDDDEVLLLLM